MTINSLNGINTQIMAAKQCGGKQKVNSDCNVSSVPSCDIKISDEGYRMYRKNLSKLENSGSIAAKEKGLDKEIFSKAVIDITGLTQLNFHSQFKKLNSKNHVDGGKCEGLDLAKNCFEIYSSMYNEIKQGYADGTREIWIVDQGAENGFRKATEDEELAALDSTYDFYAQVVDAYVNVGSKNSETIENAVNKLRADLENQKYVNRTQEEPDQKIEGLYYRLMNAADAWKKGYSADVENSYLFDTIFKNNIMMHAEAVIF